MTPDEADTRAELEQITEAMREALAQGRFIPGELLPVPQLVQQFGSGAYEMVRALLQLVATSYLIIVPDQGHQGDGTELAAPLAHVPVRCPTCSGTLMAALTLSAG
jgi:DNA-binding GntR family transcriptional regulator